VGRQLSTLHGVDIQTGQIGKAREVLHRFKGRNAAGGLDVNRIEEASYPAPPRQYASETPNPMPWSRANSSCNSPSYLAREILVFLEFDALRTEQFCTPVVLQVKETLSLIMSRLITTK